MRSWVFRSKKGRVSCFLHALIELDGDHLILSTVRGNQREWLLAWTSQSTARTSNTRQLTPNMCIYDMWPWAWWIRMDYQLSHGDEAITLTEPIEGVWTVKGLVCRNPRERKTEEGGEFVLNIASDGHIYDNEKVSMSMRKKTVISGRWNDIRLWFYIYRKN